MFRAGSGSRVGAPSVLANDSEPDLSLFHAELVTPPANGSLTFASDGSFTYIANSDFVGTDQFVYRTSDGFQSTPATVTIEVAESETYRFDASEDAGVREQAASTNYGGSTSVNISNDDDGDDHFSFAYFKFDISELNGEISQVTLDFTSLQSYRRTLSVHGVTGDWSESTLVYTNRPTTGALLASVSDSAPNVRRNVDVTSWVLAAKAAGDSTVSFRLSSNYHRDSQSRNEGTP